WSGRGTRAEPLLSAIRGIGTTAVELSEGSGLSPQPRIPRRAPSELWGAVPCWVCSQLEDGERARATSQLVAIVAAGGIRRVRPLWHHRLAPLLRHRHPASSSSRTFRASP